MRYDCLVHNHHNGCECPPVNSGVRGGQISSSLPSFKAVKVEVRFEDEADLRRFESAFLGTIIPAVQRYRGAWIDADGNLIVSCRMGGGNRECYEYAESGFDGGEEGDGEGCDCNSCEQEKHLAAIETEGMLTLLSDEDDEDDQTYNRLTFGIVPEDLADASKFIGAGRTGESFHLTPENAEILNESWCLVTVFGSCWI
jgi:hypothetical protein